MKKGTGIIMSIVSGVAGAAIGAEVVNRSMTQEVEYYKKRVDKFKAYFDVTNAWIRLKNEGNAIAEYFERNGWKHIAIYGIGELGNRLLEELKDSNIEVAYAIDQKADIYSDIKVLEVSDNLPAVDVIVVTPIFAYEEVEETLMEVTDCPIVSIEDVIFGI